MLVHSMRCAARFAESADCDCHVRAEILRRGVTPDTGWNRHEAPGQSDATGQVDPPPGWYVPPDLIGDVTFTPRQPLPDLTDLVTRIRDNQIAMLEMHAANLRSIEKLLQILTLVGDSHE